MSPAAPASGEHRYPAPGKLNLFLHVTGRRADGYHQLQSVFRLIDRCDTLQLTPRADGRIERVRELPGIRPENDLCLRAACLLQQAARCPLGVEIALDKQLPLGGGLGGGSSDAATVLLALNRLWALDWPRPRLQALALQLGADVPFFIFGRDAFVEGIGEILQPIEWPVEWYLVVEPGVEVSTAAIFAAANLTRNTKPIKMSAFSAGWGEHAVRNDLESVVCERHPEVAAALSWLRRHGTARMTGSGACVFAPFANEHDARAVLAQLPEGLKGWVAKGLQRHPLYGFADESPLGSRQVG